jgi:hypothetical protein
MIRVVDPKTGKEKVVCGAQYASGNVCMRSPMLGRDRCVFHGGKALRGTDNPNFRHGKYSKELRRDILQQYYESLAAGDQLSQTHEIALLDARISLLLRQANSGRDITEMLVGLMEIREKLLLLLEENGGREVKLEKTEARSLVRELDEIMEEFKNERRKWEEVYQVIDHRRKLIESERKAIVDSQHMMTEQQALTLLAALVNIIRKHVYDADVRNAISADIVSIAALPAGLRLAEQPALIGPDDL